MYGAPLVVHGVGKASVLGCFEGIQVIVRRRRLLRQIFHGDLMCLAWLMKMRICFELVGRISTEVMEDCTFFESQEPHEGWSRSA